MDGVLIIDKPKGYTSHDIVNVVKKKLNIKKVGHTGTLDPNATGVLPILLGNATKISKYLVEHNKSYIADLYLGKKTSTGDGEGNILEEKQVPILTENDIIKVLESFKGIQLQTPPIYSSIKIHGKKAYEYARSGKTVELKPREIEIYNLNFIEKKNGSIKFYVECSKGTYIRSLCEDIAEKLGTVGFMQELQRTSVDKFKLTDACSLDNLDKEKIISVENIFENQPRIDLNDKKTSLFLNGVLLSYVLPNEIYRIYNNNVFLGIGIMNNNLLKRDVIIDK